MNKQEKKALETKLWWAIQNTENKLFALRLQLSELSGEPDEILDAPEVPVLTDEQVLVLSAINSDGNGVKFAVQTHCIQLNKLGYVLRESYHTDTCKGTYWYITDAGRAALKAHKGRNAS